MLFSYILDEITPGSRTETPLSLRRPGRLEHLMKWFYGDFYHRKCFTLPFHRCSIITCLKTMIWEEKPVHNRKSKLMYKDDFSSLHLTVNYIFRT